MTEPHLYVRSREQLIADFAGGGEPAIKMLNLIHTLLSRIEALEQAAPPPLEGPVPDYSVDPADLAAALVRAGLMAEEVE